MKILSGQHALDFLLFQLSQYGHNLHLTVDDGNSEFNEADIGSDLQTDCYPCTVEVLDGDNNLKETHEILIDKYCLDILFCYDMNDLDDMYIEISDFNLNLYKESKFKEPTLNIAFKD